MKSAAALLASAWAMAWPAVGDGVNLGSFAHTPSSAVLDYAPDGRLRRPQYYREWVYLTSGFDMSYGAGMSMAVHTFDNVFVDPAAYKDFIAAGTWPEGAVLVIENRRAESRGSINKSGHFQGAEIIGIEVHVKDEARFPGGWAFFDFDREQSAEPIPRTAECYSCHAAHAAVDTTFVQFYPTLLPIARSKSTLSPQYLKDLASPK